MKREIKPYPFKNDVAFISCLRNDHIDTFKHGEIYYRSFHDLLWQIAINGLLDNEESVVIFHVNVSGEYGNELVLAYQTGGYKNTGVYFCESDYTKCSDICENLNCRFFQIDKKEQMVIMTESMS